MQQLSLRTKWYLLWLGSAGTGLLAYLVAIAPTLALYKQCAQLKLQLTANTPVFSEKILMQKKLRYEGLLSGYRLDSTQRNDRLLSVLSPICVNTRVRLLSLPPLWEAEMTGYRLTTRTLQLEGGFTNLLQLVYELERNPKAGRVTSMRFYAVEDPFTERVISLRAELYLQQIKESIQ